MSTCNHDGGKTDAFTAYVARVADSMDLSDWVFTILDVDPGAEGAIASISPFHGRKQAIIRFSEDFHEETRQERRQVIVHELVHCHIHPLSEMVNEDLKPLLGAPSHHTFAKSFSRLEEYAVDALATAIAQHLPLPPTPGS